MAALETLSPASFRDVPFGVDGSHFSSGRRTVQHEYPLRDTAFVEDLGRRGRVFALEAFVVGANYAQQRDRLLAALELGGPGQLVHPYYGTRIVAVGDLTIEESKDARRFAKFSITFLETSDRAFSPSIARAPLAQTEQSTLAAHNAIGQRLAGAVSLQVPTTGDGVTVLPGAGSKPVPAWSLTSLSTRLQTAVTALRTAMAPAVSGTTALATLHSQVNSLVSDASLLVQNPTQLATRVLSLLTTLRESPTTPRLGVSALLAAYAAIGSSSAASRPKGSTVTRQREQANYDAMDAFLRQSVLAEAARAAVVAAAVADGARADSITVAVSSADVTNAQASGFESYEDAIGVRDALLDAFDAQLEASADDGSYGALQQLRADVVLGVPGESQQLPRLVSDTPPITLPALVLAHRLYGSLDLVDDLVARNHVRHPGFVPGGTALQVLSRA